MSEREQQQKAKELVQRFEKEWARNREYNLRALKRTTGAEAILQSSPEIQAAIVRYVIALVGKLGDASGKDADDWVTKKGVSWATFYLLGPMLRKRVRLTQADLAAMFNQLAGLAWVDTRQLEFVGPLVEAAEKLIAADPLEPGLREAAARLADLLIGENLSPAAAQVWRRNDMSPWASDRKIAARIVRMLDEPFDPTRAGRVDSTIRS